MEVLYTSASKKRYWLDKDGLEIHRFLGFMDPALQLSAREYMPEQSMITDLKEQGYTRDTELITEEMVEAAIGKFFENKLGTQVEIQAPQPPSVTASNGQYANTLAYNASFVATAE